MTKLFILAILIAVLLPAQQMAAKSVNPAKLTCKQRLCKAGIGTRNGECFCCFNCALYNRQKAKYCTDTIGNCGACLPGYEPTPTINTRCRLAFPQNQNSTPPPKEDDGDNDGSIVDSNVQSGGGTSQGVIITSVLAIVVSVAVVLGIAVHRFKEIRHRGLLPLKNLTSRSVSQNSRSDVDGMAVEMGPIRTRASPSESENSCLNVTEEEVTLLREPVEEDWEERTVQVVPQSVQCASERLQQALPIDYNEALLNPAQTIVANEPEENDEAHLPSAPPEPCLPIFQDLTALDISSVQPDSGFHTHADSDDGASVVSSYSRAPTVRLEDSTPQGSPSSDQMEDDADDEMSSSPSFPSGYTPPAEGMLFSFKVIAEASVNFPNP